MRLYSKNQKPFVYAAFSSHDHDAAVSVLQKIEADSVSVWFAERFTKKERQRIEAAYSCIIFISPFSVRDESVARCISNAVHYNKKILCIYLEPTSLSPGLELTLNSLQSLSKASFPDNDSFVGKLKSADVFSGMQVTAAQKRFARRRGLASVFIPIASALVMFFALVYPLLIAPAVKAAAGSLSQVGFGNLSLADLARVEELNVIGTQSFDQWYFAFYRDAFRKGEVFVNELNVTMPKGSISDISDLALLKNAKEIAFEANEVSDITPLYSIQTLERLTLNCNPIKTIEGIEALQNLKDITLVCTDVSDISPLFKIPSIEQISFEETYVGSIEGIQNLKHLMGLRTGNSNVTDISPLNDIDFSYINETDGFSFEAKESLIRDFSPLQRIPRFSEVAINVRHSDSVLPFISNKEVHQLRIEGSDLSSLGALSAIRNIDVLYLSNSGALASLQGIEAHDRLIELDIRYCQKISDFRPLLQLPNLERLIISPDMKETAEPQLTGAGFEVIIRD